MIASAPHDKDTVRAIGLIRGNAVQHALQNILLGLLPGRILCFQPGHNRFGLLRVLTQQQFQRGGRLKAGEHLPLAFEHHLPRGMDIRGIELRREVQQALLFRVRHVERGGGRGPGLADEEQVTPQRGQFAEEKAEIHATLQQFSAATARQS